MCLLFVIAIFLLHITFVDDEQKAEERDTKKNFLPNNKLYGFSTDPRTQIPKNINTYTTNVNIERENENENEEEEEEKKDERQQETKTGTEIELPPKYNEKVQLIPFMSLPLPGTISISVYANTVSEIPFLISSATSSPNLILGGEMGSSCSSSYWNPSSPSFGSTSRLVRTYSVVMCTYCYHV